MAEGMKCSACLTVSADVWLDWAGFLAEGERSWTFFSRQAGNGQPRVCQHRKSVTPPHHHHHHSLQPQCVNHNGHASTSSRQNYTFTHYTFPVFIPLSVPSLFCPVPMHRTVARQVSKQWYHPPPPPFVSTRISREKVWKVFLWVVCWKG